jgi:hypothetical protein
VLLPPVDQHIVSTIPVLWFHDTFSGLGFRWSKKMVNRVSV